MAEQVQFNFVDFSRVPQRILNSAEGARIKERLSQIKAALGNNLERVELYPNAGHVNFGSGEVLNGVIYHVKRGTPAQALLPFLGPLYQHFSVFNLGTIDDSKLQECKSKNWDNIIDPPCARGSGISGYGRNAYDCYDLVELYQQRGKTEGKQWATSLGSYYPGYAITAKNKFGQAKLVLAGGHEQLHSKLARAIVGRTDMKIEDVADRNFTLDMESSLSLTIKSVKDLQIINHSHIAAKVMTALGLANFQSDPYSGFSTPVPVAYSCFYNTIHESVRQRGAQAQTFAITQGNVDTSLDLTESGATEMTSLYMIENPKRVHELSVYREYIDKVRYFPITTGSSEFAVLGMSEKDRIEIRDNAHWTGISTIHNIGQISYQPYDPTLKINTNMLFGGHGYAVVASDQALEGVMYSVTGFDPKDLTVDDYLKYTQHLNESAIVKAPVNSAPVNLIFQTFPHVLDTLKTQGVDKLELFQVVKGDDQSSHYVQFPVATLRLAQHVSKMPLNVESLTLGQPKIYVQN
jgi:hypothetical protein